MLRRLMLVLCLLLFGTAAWGETGLLQKSQAMFEPIPLTPPTMAGNPATPEKLDLGRMLYFDPRLSASQLISCQTCHNVGLGGVDLQETSTGHGWQKGPRNAPTVLNAVFNVAQFWDGRAKDLAEQAKGPVQASVEMNNSPEKVIATLNSIPEYIQAFDKAFPGSKDPVSFDNMALAIEAFEATLLTPNARFDKYLRGDEKALTKQEKDGLKLYMDKGCASCHNGINIGGLGYFPFGVVEVPDSAIRPPEDKGRFKVTNTAADQYVFRAPPLRNILLTPPYFHSGKVWSLQTAVEIMGSSQLGVQISDAEAAQIVDFLATLTGEQPQVVHPTLPPNGPNTPHPDLSFKASAAH